MVSKRWLSTRAGATCRLLSACLVAWLFALPATAQHTRAQWIAEFDRVDALVNGGNGYSTSSDSSTLGWGEAPNSLMAYLSMYQATANTTYLDKFVAHVNNMAGTMSDPDGDGYLGWNTARYSVNVVPNPGAEAVDPNDNPPVTLLFNEGFETPDPLDSTLPAGWERWQSTSSTAFRDAQNAYAGGYGCTVVNNPSRGWQIIQKAVSDYTGDGVYRLDFMARTTTAAGGGRVDVLDATTPAILCSYTFTNSAWLAHRVYFTAPAQGGHTLKIRLYQSDWQITSSSAHYDNVSLSRVDGDLKPDRWERWQSTAQTAYRDPINKRTGNAGFTVATNPSVGWQVLQAPLENLLVTDNHRYEPGVKYSVSFYAKTDGGAAGGRLTIQDFTTGQTLLTQSFTNTGTYQIYSGVFTAPAAPNHDVKVRLLHSAWNVAGTAYFDDISVNQYAEYIVHDGMIAIPLARFVKMVNLGEAPASYASGRDTCLGLLQNHLVPKWDSLFRSENGTEGVYIFPDDGSSNIPNTTVPHNQYLAITEAFMLLAQATGNADYEVRAGLLATAFRNSLRPVGTAFEWDYWNPKLSTDGTPSWSPSVEDTSHGGLDVAAAIRGYETGIVFDRADMDCLVSTLLDVMWDQNTTDPNIGDRVNTSAGTLYKYNTGSNWNRLGMFDPLAYSVVRTLFENKWNTSGMTYSDLADIAEIICSDNILQDEFETENSVDPTLPDGWVRWQSSSATAYMDSPAAYEGRFALTVKTNPSGGWQVIEKVFPYQPGTAYTVGFLGRAANTNVGGRAEIRDATTNTVLGYRTFTNTGWASQSFTFVAPVAGHTVKIRLYPAAWNVANGIVHYENVRIHE